MASDATSESCSSQEVIRPPNSVGLRVYFGHVTETLTTQISTGTAYLKFERVYIPRNVCIEESRYDATYTCPYCNKKIKVPAVEKMYFVFSGKDASTREGRRFIKARILDVVPWDAWLLRLELILLLTVLVGYPVGCMFTSRFPDYANMYIGLGFVLWLMSLLTLPHYWITAAIATHLRLFFGRRVIIEVKDTLEIPSSWNHTLVRVITEMGCGPDGTHIFFGTEKDRYYPVSIIKYQPYKETYLHE